MLSVELNRRAHLPSVVSAAGFARRLRDNGAPWGPEGQPRTARVSRLDGTQSKAEISLMAGPERSEDTVLCVYHSYG